MKKIIGIFLCMLMGFSLISCGSGSGSSNKFATKADSLSIEPGITKLQDLINNGFTYKWSEIATKVDEIKGKQFITPWIEIIKDGEKYATIGLINKTGSSLKLEECVVGDIIVYPHYNAKNYHQFTEITVNNENVVGLTYDDIKAKFKDKPNHESEKSLVFNDGKHSYDFEFDEQKVVKSITFDINEREL